MINRVCLVQVIAVLACLGAGRYAPPAPGARVAAPLADTVAEGRVTTGPVGAFQHKTIVIDVGTGPVLLAAQPDGMGDLRTDDQAALVVQRPDGTRATWSHDYRAGSGAIVSIAPQDVSALFARGRHTVTLTLVDLAAPAHSSSAYYLVYAAPPAVSVISLPTAALPTAMPTRKPQATAPGQVAATQTAVKATPEPAFIAPTLVSIQGQRVAEGTEASGITSQGLVLSVGATVATATLVVGAVRRKRSAVLRDALAGIAELYDAGTNERVEGIDLTQFNGSVAVYAHPLRFAARHERGVAVAWLYRDAHGMQCQVVAQKDAAPVTLNDMDEIGINEQVTLTYRAALPSASLNQGGIL